MIFNDPLLCSSRASTPARTKGRNSRERVGRLVRAWREQELGNGLNTIEFGSQPCILSNVTSSVTAEDIERGIKRVVSAGSSMGNEKTQRRPNALSQTRILTVRGSRNVSRNWGQSEGSFLQIILFVFLGSSPSSRLEAHQLHTQDWSRHESRFSPTARDASRNPVAQNLDVPVKAGLFLPLHRHLRLLARKQECAEDGIERIADSLSLQCEELVVFDREREDHLYQTIPATFAIFLSNLPLAILATTRYAIMIYFMGDSAVMTSPSTYCLSSPK